jgi:beta-galactosidase
MPELEGEIESLEITDEVYSTRCTFKELYENPEAAAVLDKFFGEDFRNRPTFSMTQGFTIDTLAEMAPDHFHEKLLYALNRELTKIKRS